MAKLFKDWSKFWIYLPIYLVILIASVIWLYRYLNPIVVPEAAVIEEIIEEIKEEEPAAPSWINCFEAHKEGIEGILSITPTTALSRNSEHISDDCLVRFCQEMANVNAGRLGILDFYAKCERDRTCMAKVLANAEAYHQQQLLAYDLFPLFYDAGQSQLNTTQKKNLSFFLNIFKKRAADVGLLIIGRASATGRRDKNKQLSKSRAEQIIDFIDGLGMEELNSDFVYFGADPPQLTKSDADKLRFDQQAYRNINFGNGSDKDFVIRLNQSVLLIIYDKKLNPFDLQYETARK